MKKEIDNTYPDNNCFFCGKDNEKGLNLRFYWDEDDQEVFAEYLPHQCFIGQGEILHGGIQMGILDEIMVTSGLEIKFLRPSYVVGKKLKITCRVTSKGAELGQSAEEFHCGAAVCQSQLSKR